MMNSAREAVERLAHILHEAGRDSVTNGLILNRGPWGGESFVEWAELPEYAKDGRRSQARYLIEHKLAVMSAIEAAFE